MATLIEKIARRLTPKVLSEISPADVRDALVALSPSERQDLLRAVRRLQREKVGGLVLRAVTRGVVDPRALAEAEAMAIDGEYSDADLERILNGELPLGGG